MASYIEVAMLSAEWVAVAITLIGLSSLVIQITSLAPLLDPFRNHRGRDWLGPWAMKHKNPKVLVPFKGEIPRGPEIYGTYAKGFCGLNVIHISRKPASGQTGMASWTKILAVFHPNPLSAARRPVTSCYPSQRAGQMVLEDVLIVISPENSWKQRLESRELIKHGDKVCTRITRTAFVTCLVLTNSYQIYKYSDASGLRTSYSGYSGTWQLHWPLGGIAEIEFYPLDSYDEGQEMYPLSFPRRADKCILMLAGILECSALGKLAFPEPKDEGASVLELLQRGFIAHGKTSHLFNMMGGNSYEVDHLYRRALQEDDEKIHANELKLAIPAPESDLNRKPVKPRNKRQNHSIVYVPPAEEQVLATALDCLPWSTLSWSIHRGMQCLLLAYGDRVMKSYRRAFAHTLKVAIKTHASVLELQGWSSSIVRDHMAENTASSVMASEGDSGDIVRMVTAAAHLLTDKSQEALDETRFWRSFVGHGAPSEVRETQPLDDDAVIALTKFFVLEWSNELDHKIYDDLPLFMLVA